MAATWLSKLLENDKHFLTNRGPRCLSVPFRGKHFDWAVKLIGSGAPRLVIPVPSTKPINQRLADGWQMSKTIRLGIRKDGRLWIDFIFEKERPVLREQGRGEKLVKIGQPSMEVTGRCCEILL